MILKTHKLDSSNIEIWDDHYNVLYGMFFYDAFTQDEEELKKLLSEGKAVKVSFKFKVVDVGNNHQ